MQWMQYMLPVLLSCFTGWLVTWLAWKMLFHPVRPVSLPGFKLQGLIPGNKQAIAERLGKLVSDEFLSFPDLKEKITSPDNFNKLKPEIEKHIDHFLREKLKDVFPMLSMFIGDKTINQLKAAFLLELENLFPVIMQSYMTRLEQDSDIERTVMDKLAGLSLAKAEEWVNRSAAKMFLSFQMMGLLTGLVMGLLHIFVNMQVYS